MERSQAVLYLLDYQGKDVEALHNYQRYMALIGDKPDTAIVNHMHHVEEQLKLATPIPSASS